MSYDIDIADQSFNYTWNLGSLFYDFIPSSYSERGGLHELAGLTGKQAHRVLHDAFQRMSSGEVRSAKYDAPNGWGSTTGALIFLALVMAACAEHPRHKVRFST